MGINNEVDPSAIADGNIERDDLDQLIDQEPSPIKRSLAVVYDRYLSRPEYIQTVLPSDVSVKAALDNTMIRLLALYPPDEAEAIISSAWKQYHDSEEAA